jgi:uncharacterized protein (UPF0332 family)
VIEWKIWVNKGLIKEEQPDLAQIERQVVRARKDLRTFLLVVEQDPEWASTIAYQAMLRAGRALIFTHGFLPADGQQHKTVIEITGQLLGKDYDLVIRHFDRMRKKRNVFFYDSEDANNLTEARKAVDTARDLIEAVKNKIRSVDPQHRFKF